MPDDEFRIAKVVMENYRQYYGEVEANFSTDPGSFSVFLGQNGEGKSNLLNAINWCLFENEPHRRINKSLPIFNVRYLKEVPKEQKAEMRVTVLLYKGDTKIKIERVLVGIKHDFRLKKENGTEVFEMVSDDPPVPAGLEIQPHMSTQVYQESKDGGDWEKVADHAFESLVSSILPKTLSEFFILDGEFLEKLFTKLEGLERGIVQISQLSLLSTAKAHVHNSRLGRGSQGLDTRLDELNAKIEKIDFYLDSHDSEGREAVTKKLIWGATDEYYHYSGRPKVADLTRAKNAINSRLREIMQEIYESNAESNAMLNDKLEDLERQQARVGKDQDTLRSAIRKSLIDHGPKLLLEGVLKDAHHLIEKEVEKGNLPNYAKMNFTSDLLSKGVCLCGTPLGAGSEARKNAEDTMRQAGHDKDMDLADNIRHDNRQSIDRMQEYRDGINRNRSALQDLDDTMQDIRDQRRAINAKFSGSGKDDYKRLLADQSRLQDELASINSALGRENSEIEKKEAEKRDLAHKRTNLDNRNQKVREKVHQLTISEAIQEILDMAYAELGKDIRENVAEKTTEYFKSIIWKKDFVDTVSIDPQYKISVITTDGFDAVDDLAAGERLFLTLSFIMALREITGYKFPLVIDTPLGKIAGKPRRLLAENLPGFLRGAQLTLLATDTEYIASSPDIDTGEEGEPFQKILGRKVAVKESRIKMEKDASVIVPYRGSGS